MIRYSHVSLVILCKTKDEVATVTAHLGFQPSRVKEVKYGRGNKEADRTEDTSYHWMFDSPKSAEEADPTERLWALTENIEAFGDKVLSLDKSFHRWVDVLYNITAQHPNPTTCGFDWFCLPAALMRRFVAWNLDISYESIRVDHPNQAKSSKRGWLNIFQNRQTK